MPKPAIASETSGRILDIAEHLVQTRGFNAFSYADIAAALHITKASLHYHFPSKAVLGERLIARYRGGFLAALTRIDESHDDTSAKLHAYVGIYTAILDNNRMCLCGMLAAEYTTLPEAMKQEVRQFFEANEVWLVNVLERGRNTAHLSFAGSPAEAARVLVAALEGAMMLARVQADPSRLRSVAHSLLADLGVTATVPRKATA
jgi:TetR/AcrR family transcriptional regulator, transcriptional repressor for nem operon